MSMDRSVFVREDETIILQEENDGWTYMRRGPEARECVVKIDHATKSFKALDGSLSLWSDHLYESAVRQLAASELKRKEGQNPSK
jgi:hypothetical protein